MKKQRRGEAGFTLIEVMISLAVLSILLSTVFTITVETTALISDVDVSFSAQNEANKGLTRMTEILRKTGRNAGPGVQYPRVLDEGKEIEFRLLTDLDGNGFFFDAATGELEWGAKVYRIRRNAEGSLDIYDGDTAVWHLCRHVSNISFATYLQDPALQFREISVTLEITTFTRRDEPIEFALTGSIDMRN